MSAKMSFELDAGKILAKLHRGACQLHNDFIFINTGVTDDQKGLTPEQVDKAKINFDMEGGEYEIGVILPEKLATEKLPADMQKAKAKDDANADAEDEEESGDSGTASKDKQKQDENTPITDNPDQKSANESVLAEDYTKNKASAGNSSKDKETPKTKEQATDAKQLSDFMLKLQSTTDPAEMEETSKNIADLTKKMADGANAVVVEAVKKNHDAIKKFMELRIKHAAKYLKEYLQVFAGKDASEKINEKNMALCYVPEGFDPYKTKKYDKYQIPVMTDEQVREYKIKLLQKDKGKSEYSIERMCFKIAYTLDIGK